ncbi:MAG: motility protein MotB, partial [Bacteroidetes bacterium HGW-Bacteroidetes-21]
MTDNREAPIIIKKSRKKGGGAHGGSWKVAYADFVTAMMAFFLLMWLLNMTSQQQ